MKLKNYRLFIASCPFTKATYYFANKTIVDVLEGRTRLHIIDFGIALAIINSTQQ
jgi:hypothetical protein